jgi:DNA repair exonuclease SbcCD nuclease subunit
MPTVRFVQISDLHLDSSLASGRLGLPPDKVRTRQREIRGMLPAACALAVERKADLILVPGDLFDDEAVTMDTVNFVVETLAGVGSLPVVVTPGNHDFYSLGSPYNNDLLAARRQRPWSSNVKIFRSGSWEVWRPESIPWLSITGMAHAGSAPIGERLLAARLPRDAAASVSLLVFHGSRDNTDLPRGKSRTLPFSDAELAAQGFDYAAVGHYHEPATLTDPASRILGAYAGCPAGRGLDETGEKSVVVGEVSREEGGGGPARVRIERVALDRRRIHLVEVPCTGLTHREAVFRRGEELLAVRDCRADDIVCLRLSGRVAPGIDLRPPERYLADRFFHVTVDVGRLRPAYDLDRYRREELRTTEARFAREMLRRMEAASDPAERRLLESALFYGLDALIQKEVVPRYEE